MAMLATAVAWFHGESWSMKRDESALSFKVFTPLVLAVLLAHWVLLQGMLMRVELTPTSLGQIISTRSIDALPVAKVASSKAVKRALTLPATGPLPTFHPVAAQDPPSVVEPIVVPAQDAARDERASSRSEDAVTREPEVAEVESLVQAPRHLREDVAWASRYSVPASLNLKYEVSSNKFPFSLNAEMGWRQDGESYDARLAFGAFGLRRVQTSRGQITADGLSPSRFSDKYRSEVAAHFVREKGQVTFSANTPDAPLLAGAQDRLSVVLQLAAMIAGDPDRFPRASTITLQIIGPRDADIWLFTVEEDETLNLPGGQLATRKLVRNPRREFDQRVELWLAPALGYLPARIRITEANGDYIDQKWLSSEAPV